MSAMRDDNRRLSSNLTELRAERRLQDRKLRDLQRQLDLARAQVVQSTIEGVPSLPVEVAGPERPISPSAPRVVGVTEDGEEIVYEGDAAAGKIATLDDDPTPAAARTGVRPPPVTRDDDRIEVTRRTPSVSVAARRAPSPPRERPSDRDGDAATDYRVAVDLVKGGQHEAAVTALRNFIGKYPRHDYADNAQYWLGETFYAAKDYPQALIEFRNVVETYPRGNKVPDALLKVGYCYQSMGQTEKARAVLEQVVNLYPKTEPAALAAKRLEKP
jgi:tol-pal system protein YbgF